MDVDKLRKEWAQVLAYMGESTPGEWAQGDSLEEGQEGTFGVLIPEGHNLLYDLEGSCPQCFGNVAFIAAACNFMKKYGPTLLKELDAMADEIAEHDQSMAMQYRRMGQATRLWQQETGRMDAWPDLGDLLAWLIERGGRVSSADPEHWHIAYRPKLLDDNVLHTIEHIIWAAEEGDEAGAAEYASNLTTYLLITARTKDGKNL